MIDMIPITPYQATACINSLKGEKREITVLGKIGENRYVVEYNGIKCTAIFNWITCYYYADDKYGIIKEN